MTIAMFRLLRRIDDQGARLWRAGDRDAARIAWGIYGRLTAAAFGPGANLYGPFELLP